MLYSKVLFRKKNYKKTKKKNYKKIQNPTIWGAGQPAGFPAIGGIHFFLEFE